MYFWAILFWIALFVAIAWCGWLSVGLLVSKAYYPMSALGDLFYPLRIASVPMLILFAFVMLALWFRQRPLTRTVYLLGLTVVSVIAVLPVLPRIDSGHKQVKYVGEEKYEIPWKYAPYGGSSEPGGKSFRVVVSKPGLVPRYDTRANTISIGVSTEYIYDRNDAVSEYDCSVESGYGRTRCQWTIGGRTYSAYGDSSFFSKNPAGFFTAVSLLLDSFRVDPPQN